MSGLIARECVIMNDQKIFQIGFNKSATVSICNYFKNQGFKAVHWDKGRLSKKIKVNYELGLPLLTGYEEYQVFTDMEHIDADGTLFYSAEEFYKELDTQYPNSIFILNYRNLEDWILSRKNHQNYLESVMLSKRLSESEVIEYWKKRYNEHICSVNDYFNGRNNLIRLDLDNDDNDKLFSDLTARGVVLTSKLLPRNHKTTKDNEFKVNDRDVFIDSIREAAVYFEKNNDIGTAISLMSVAHKLRPKGLFIKHKLDAYRLRVHHNQSLNTLNYYDTFSPKLNMWYKEAFEECGLWKDDTKFDTSYIIFPKRYYEAVAKLSQKKLYDFCFIGAFKVDEETEKNRDWIIEFIKDNFSEDSYLQFTDKETKKNYTAMGDFDLTLNKQGMVPKETKLIDRNRFDKNYFSTMCHSKFILCPAGDVFWSMRFFEALMCRCIPVVKSVDETFRSFNESKLGYKYYLTTDDIVYRDDWVEHNYNIFLKRHTLSSD